MKKIFYLTIIILLLSSTTCNFKQKSYISLSVDTYIESAFPNLNNYFKDYIAFGNCGSATDYTRTLLKFDVSDIQKAASSGTLTMTWKEKGSELRGSKIQVYLMSKENHDFGEGASFAFKDINTMTLWVGTQSHLSGITLISTYKKWKTKHKTINVIIPKSVINDCIQNRNGIISLLIKVENDENPEKTTETKWHSSESSIGKPTLKFSSQ